MPTDSGPADSGHSERSADATGPASAAGEGFGDVRGRGESQRPARRSGYDPRSDFSDSHILGAVPMIPHHSDGSTDVIVRGRDEELEAPDPVAPMFPQPSPLRTPDDATTLQLPQTQACPPVLDETLVMGKADAMESSPEPAHRPEDHPAAEPTFSTQRPAPPSEPATFGAPAFEATPAALASATSPAQQAPAPPGKGLLFILLVSYASAVTLALIYLLWSRGVGDQQRHQLEDLRDPVDEQGTVRIYRRDAELPPGHVLMLGEARRFGAIQVEPLRVTLGPIAFQHFSGDRRKRMPDSPPVLKLWLRFTNLSTTQKIAPLDALLLYKRQMNHEGVLVANAFVCQTTAQSTGPVVFSYPAALNSEWDMDDQSLGRQLEPGESLETYIPSDVEGLDQLMGPLVWRFQMRKGYAPTGRGVTTLVEVRFNSDEIESQRPAKTAAASSADGMKDADSASSAMRRCVGAAANDATRPLAKRSQLHQLATA